jgi:hypothetical protein
MPNTPQPLPGGFQSVQIILDGSGNGIARIGPTRVREHWQVTGAAVKVATAINEAQCAVYVGPQIADPYAVDTTITGSTGDVCSFANQDVQPGQFVFAQWTGGDPGATATLNVIGTYSIGSPS